MISEQSEEAWIETIGVYRRGSWMSIWRSESWLCRSRTKFPMVRCQSVMVLNF